MLFRAISLCLVAVLVSCGGGGGGGAPASVVTPTPASWSFSADTVALGLTGVSPGALLMKDGSVRIYLAPLSGGLAVYRATDGLNFKLESVAPFSGSDPTPVILPDGSYRVYAVTQNAGGVKFLYSMVSADGLSNWSTPVPAGISDPVKVTGWGVPNVIKAPDNTYRAFWVASPSETGPPNIESATSADGITFTQDGGHRLSNYVDPQILKADPSDWLAVFSTRPGFGLQQLYLANSSDGLNWTVDPRPITSVAGKNIVDPASVRLDAKTFRIYYSVSAGTDPFLGPFTILSGVLKMP